MTDDVCLTCPRRDKVACASCWSRFVILSETPLTDSDLFDVDLWATVGVEYEP